MALVLLDPENAIVGHAWADTEDDVRAFRAKMKAIGFRVTARRKYETFMGKRFPKPGAVIRLKWETM